MQYASPLTPEAELLLNEIENRRRAKARGRIAKMLAKKRGDLRRMPLTGKAALAAIRAGQW
jgi:hypothetical protein